MAQGSVKDTTGYVNYVYNISARGTSQVASQLLGLSGITSNILGQLAFQTSSYLSSTEGALLSIGVVATAGLGKAAQQAMEFDQALSTIGAISGKTRDQVGDLGEEAMDMSAKFGVAVSEMTHGLESLARAGVSANNMNAILEQAMGLSKLEGLSLETAINDLISTTNLLDTKNLDLESPEYAEAVAYQNQKITATSEAAPINAQDIIHTLEHIGGYASSTNLDQDDLYAVIAQLGSKGTKSEMAGTSLRAFISAGQKDTAQRALARIGLTVEDLWKNDDTIMSITDMKDVLDEAMEAKGYTQQEKLEFYSDFAGYKQANQIMKIDTTSAREFKEKIDHSWNMGQKIEQVIGTAETNFQGMVQAGTNFLTKVGEPLLPIISTVSWVTKNIIGLIDKIPGSHLLILSGGILVGIKAISTIFNKIGPQLLESTSRVGLLKDFFKDIRKSLDDSLTIIKAIGDEEAIRDISFENEVTNVTDADRLEYYKSQGYNVKTPEEIIKIRSEADDEKIIEHKRQRLNDIAAKRNQEKKEDKDERVGQNRKKQKSSVDYDKIIDPLNKMSEALININNIIDRFGDKTNKDVKSDSSPLHVAIDLSTIEQKLDSVSKSLSVLYTISNDINGDNFKSKAQLDDATIKDLKNHIWKVEIQNPYINTTTITKGEREKIWKSEGKSLDDFIKKAVQPQQTVSNASTTKPSSTKSSSQTQSVPSKVPDRLKGSSGYITPNDINDVNASTFTPGYTSADYDKFKRKRKPQKNPQYGDTPTPDYEGDGTYGFSYENYEMFEPGKDAFTSSFDVGVSKGDFRTAQGRLNRARRIYNQRHKDAKIKDKNWQARLTDIFLEDQNSPIIKEITEIMREDTGDQADKFLTSFFKQMTPIRTRGSIKLSDDDFSKLRIERTGSDALDTVASLIEQKFANYQSFLNTTGFSLRTDLNPEQIETEFDNVISLIFKTFGEARLNLQETNPHELQDVTLTPDKLDKTLIKGNVMVLADAMGLLGKGNITRENIFSKDGTFTKKVLPAFENKADLLKGSLILGSLQQAPLMKSLKSLYKSSGYEKESSFMSNVVVAAFNDALEDHENLQLSMRGLDIGKKGQLIKGDNRLENIVYSLAMESKTTDDQDALSAFLIDFMKNMQLYAGVSDVKTQSVINEAKDYDTKRREEARKDLSDIDLTKNATENNLYTIEAPHHRGQSGTGAAISDESGIDSGWGEDSEMYNWKEGGTGHSRVGGGAKGDVIDDDFDSSASAMDLEFAIRQHGPQLEYIAEAIRNSESSTEIETLEERLDAIFSGFSPEVQNSLAAAYGLGYTRIINKEPVDIMATDQKGDPEYYNGEYGRNTAFFNGVELGDQNDRKATFSQHLMFLSEELDPLLKKASALKHEMQVIADIKMLQDLGLLDEEFKDDLDFLKAIHNLVADIHVKGKALQGRHRGYRGLGNQDTPAATTGVAIREQGNVAADKNVIKVLPDPDNKDRNYVKEKLERRSLGTIANLVSPIYGRAGLPETGGMKLPLKHVEGFNSIPWLMQRANSPVEVMYALDNSDYHDTGRWIKNAQGNYANIWTPEAMMKRLAATTMGSVIENLGALALYDKTTGEEGDEHIITSANIKNLAATKLTPQMLQSVDFMYEQQGFTSLTDLKMRAGDNYDAFVDEVHARMDTAAPEPGFKPDEQANNQFKRWVNDDELARLENEGLLDIVKNDKGKAITRQIGKGEDAYTQHLVYDWEALRLSKEEIAQQYMVMMLANAMHAQEVVTQKMAMSPSVFEDFRDEAYNLSSTIISDPRKFLSMSKSDLISYGVADDQAFFSIGKTLQALSTADPEKITSLLRDVTVGELGSEFVDKLSEMGYYADYDDENFQATNVATIAESFGGTYELIVEILQDMFYQIEQMRDINAIVDPDKKIAESVKRQTEAQLASDAATRYNTTTEKELHEIKRNIHANQNSQGYVPYSGNAWGDFYSEHIESDMVPILDKEGNVIGSQYMPPIGRTNIPYKEQKFIPDMWQRSMAEDPEIVTDIWEEVENYLNAIKGMDSFQRKGIQLAFSKEVVDFVESNDLIQTYTNDTGSFVDIGRIKADFFSTMTPQYIPTRMDQQNEELKRASDSHKNYPTIKGQNRKSFLTPDLVVDINSSNSSDVWDHNSRAFKNKKALEEKLDVIGDTIVSRVSPGDVIGQGALENMKQINKKKEEKRKDKKKKENYITPYDAMIVDDSYSDPELNIPDQPKYVGDDVTFTQQKINAMNKKADKEMNEINEQNERKKMKQFIKIGIRNIELGNHTFAQSFLEVAKTHFDYDNLYKEAEAELAEEREEEKYKNQLKALFPDDKKNDNTDLNLKNQAASLINQSVKETEELIEEMTEIEEIKDELRTIVTNFKEQFNIKIGDNKQTQSKEYDLADMYGAQDYINMFGEQEGLSRSDIGYKEYKSFYANDEDLGLIDEDLLNQHNKMTWKKPQVVSPPSASYLKGKQKTEETTSYIQQKVNDISSQIANKMEQISLSNVTEANSQLNIFGNYLTNSSESLMGVKSALEELADVFPPLTMAIIGLQTVITFIEKATIISSGIKSIISAGDKLSTFDQMMAVGELSKEDAVISLFGHSIEAGSNKAKILTGISGVLSTAITTLTSLLNQFLGPIILITTAIMGVKTALDWSYNSHKDYLQKLEDEEKQNKSRSKSLATITEQSKKAALQNKAEKQQDSLNRAYALNSQRLHGANLRRTTTAIELTRAQNDTVWGQYGIASALDKMQGKYESNVEDYDGSTGQIRRIKESTLGGQGLVRGMPGYFSPAQEQVAAYYDANQLALGRLDEYIDELGQLYDAETSAMLKYHTTDVRGSPEFQHALDKFVEATGIEREHAEQYLDYMQTEHNVDKATQSMQAQADAIKANTEFKIQAIAFGGNPSDVLGLNGIEAQQNAMVQAQADIIQLELSSQLWWKAVWSTITSPIRAIISPVFAITHILGAIWSFITGNWDAAGRHMQQAGSSLNVLGETATYWGAWSEVESTDFNSIGQNAIDERNRANYGNVGEAPKTGYMNAKNPEDNSIFGIFPVGWPDGKRPGAHGVDEHKAQLSQNAQQSLLTRIISPIESLLGIIKGLVFSILAAVTLSLALKKTDLLSKLPDFMQGPLGIISGIGHSLYDNLVPTKVKEGISFTSTAMEYIGGRLYNRISDAIPDSWKERFKNAKGRLGTAKDWIKDRLGLGEDEGITEENDPVGAATIESKNYLKQIVEWLMGKRSTDELLSGKDKEEEPTPQQTKNDNKKRINIEDTSEEDGEDIPIKKKKRINIEDDNNDIVDENKRGALFGNLDFYMPDRVDNILNDIIFGTFHDAERGSAETAKMGRNINFNTALIEAFGDDKEGAAHQLVADYIHEISHSILKHAVRQTNNVPNNLSITRTEDNYDYRASELEAREVTRDFFSESNIANPHDNASTLSESIQKAVEAGTYDEVNGILVAHLSKELYDKRAQVLSDLVTIIDNSDDEYMLSIKDAVVALITDKENGFGVDLLQTQRENATVNNDFANDIVDENRRILQRPKGEQGAIEPVNEDGAIEPIKGYGAIEPVNEDGVIEPVEEYGAIEPVPEIPKNISQAVRMQTIMPSKYGKSGEEIAEMEKEEIELGKAREALSVLFNDTIESRFKNTSQSQGVMAQILPFLGIEPEFDEEEFKIRNRGQKYGNRVTESMSGEEIAQREKEQRKYYKKPQTYEEAIRPQIDYQKELDEDFALIDSSEWHENHKRISKEQRQTPKSDLAAKGKRMKENAAQYQAAGMLGQMMENPQATAYDTVNKMEGVQICPECGQKVPIGDKICMYCGARLDGKGRIAGALSNKFEQLKHTVTGGEAGENMSFSHRMQQLSGMGKRAQRKRKTNESAMDAGMKNMGLFGQMMDNTQEMAEKARTQGLKICPECGHQNPPDSIHCESCGARLDGRGRIGGFFADKMTQVKGKVKEKTTDKVKNKINDTKDSVKSKIDGTVSDSKAKAEGPLGDILETVGNNDLYVKGRKGLSEARRKLALAMDPATYDPTVLTTPGFNPNAPHPMGDARVRVPVQDDTIPKVKVPTIKNPKTGKPYDLSHHDVEEPKPSFIDTGSEYAQRRMNGEDRGSIISDMLTRDGEGRFGLSGEGGAFNKVGKGTSKIGSFLQGQGGKAGKVGNVLSKGGNLLSGIGKKGVSNVAKGIGGKVMGGIGKKLATKGIAQIGSKVLGGALMATGIGAPLGLLLESPLGGMLIEGALNLGGSLLGGVGKAAGRGLDGIGRALGFGRGLPGEGGGPGGLLGGALAASPLGILAGGIGSIFGGGTGGGPVGGIVGAASGLAAGAGNMIKGLFGGGSKNQAKASMKPQHVKAGQNAEQMTKNLKNIDKASDITSQHNEKIAGKAAGILDQVKQNNNQQTSNGGNITISNININTADDPEAIKEMFLELLIELQEQVNPRLVSRTAGQASNSETTTDTSSTENTNTPTGTEQNNSTNQNTNSTQ